MHDDIVPGRLLSREGKVELEDLSVEILHEYGIEKPEAMKGSPVLK